MWRGVEVKVFRGRAFIPGFWRQGLHWVGVGGFGASGLGLFVSKSRSLNPKPLHSRHSNSTPLDTLSPKTLISETLASGRASKPEPLNAKLSISTVH